MANNDPFAENRNLDASAQEQHASTGAPQSGKSEGKKMRRNFPDVQSATRFPIHLPIAVKSRSGESYTSSENISANGVLFQVDSEMPIGSMVDFTISLPADVLGSEADVKLDCRGRVVRSSDDGGRRDVGVVIDEYRFDRR